MEANNIKTSKQELIKAVSAKKLQEANIPELQYIVKNMLYEGLTIVAGAPKIGKSWWALQLGLTVSQGEAFLGFETHKCDVLYLALEDSYRRLQTRLNIMLEGKEAPEEFLFSIRCKQLDAGLIDQLKRILNEKPNIKLVLIDTLQLIRGQMSKNDGIYGNDYKEISQIKKFADDNHIAIVLIHHFRKMSDSSDTFMQVSGSTGITGAADTMITLSKEQRFDQKVIMSLTGRDIEGGEFYLNSDVKNRQWILVMSKEEYESNNQKSVYENNPIIKTIKELLDENPDGVKISSTDLYDEVIFRRKIKPKQANPAAMTRYINKMKTELAKYDNIHYEAPNSNGGAGGRKLYFCRTK